ncbi:MAG: ArsR family transcriptional regulator [Armatimonadota bacterium]|nr:ArsR family transcriptional regulator [bacterium]
MVVNNDSTRLEVVQMLAPRGELCVCRIVETLGMNQPAIPQRMAKLKQAGLLSQNLLLMHPAT